MRTISFWLFIFALAAFTAAPARAQEDPTQQQIDKLSGQIQDLLDAQAVEGKRIDALEKQVGDLQDKLNQPGGGSFASADDLKKLADQVQDLDKKRQADNDQILKELEKLDKAFGVAASGQKSTPVVSTGNSTTAAGGTQKGYYYEIKSGDTLSAISKAYRDQGIKVSVDQILAANPGLNPKNMIVGKKIFIPQP